MCDFPPGVKVKDSEGLTPLMYAAKLGLDKSMNVLTMQRSNDLNEEDANSMTILMHTAFEPNGKGIPMARKLLKRGAFINYVNRNGNTVLHLCVQRKLFKSTEFLL